MGDHIIEKNRRQQRNLKRNEIDVSKVNVNLPYDNEKVSELFEFVREFKKKR